MENAVDALKIGFAVMVFVIALAIIFSLVSTTKSTADHILYYSDRTNYYKHVTTDGTNRTVSTPDVIATLYRYYRESLSVTVILNSGAHPGTYTFDVGRETSLLGNPATHIQVDINTEELIEENIAEFVQHYLPANGTFSEQFVEIPISGIYRTGTDGSEITFSSGGKKVFITYTQIP